MSLFNQQNFQSSLGNEINSMIQRLNSTKEPQESFLYSSIQEFLNSEKFKMMVNAQKYYMNDNDIIERKRYYIDRKGIKQEAKNLSNAKLSHPFLKKLTAQKVNYLLSKEFSVQVASESSRSDMFALELGKYLDKNFMRLLKNVGKDAIINGIAWVQVYYNEQGELKFKRTPSKEVIPFWGDADHTELEAVIRRYIVTDYKPDGSREDIVKIEYHTSEGVWYYTEDKDGLKADIYRENPGEVQGHFVVLEKMKTLGGKDQLDENGEIMHREIQATWNKIPFVGFKYNVDEVSLLKWVKPMIDDYDIVVSDTSNNLQDVPNSIKVVRNYDGTDKGEFVQNLATYRTAFVSGDGDMTSINTPLEISAIDSHLDRLRKDIYEAGSGVDTQEIALGSASGIALKFRYIDLDADMNAMANEFAVAIEHLIWFIKVDMLNRGIGDFIEEEFDVLFNTDTIINEQEVIQNARESVGVISDKTILANHPWVTDVALEQERMYEEKKSEYDNPIDFDFAGNYGEYEVNEPTDDEDEIDDKSKEQSK